MGRTGKLDFSVDKVRAANGKYIPLRYMMHGDNLPSPHLSTGRCSLLSLCCRTCPYFRTPRAAYLCSGPFRKCQRPISRIAANVMSPATTTYPPTE